METLVLIVHVLLALAVIALVLLQRGKGAEAGAAFGGGASQTVFGSQGSGSFLVRVTAVLAVLFFVTSFALAVFAKQKADSIQGAGIPAPAAVEAQEENDLPELDAGDQAKPADSDVPVAE